MREVGPTSTVLFKRTKHGSMFCNDHVELLCLELISADNYFDRKAKAMSIDTDKAVERTNRVTAEFSTALDRMAAVQARFADESKKASAAVRDATDKMAHGLARIEKAANFDRLERYVDLLERAATAMYALAELERSGKLEKIASAIR